jgi:hypothetical protein
MDSMGIDTFRFAHRNVVCYSLQDISNIFTGYLN